MTATWDDDYLTVMEIAEHLKLNPQTVRNWIDQGRLPAVRIGRRVRIRRADLDRLLDDGATAPLQAPPSAIGPADAREQLAHALGRAHRLLGRRSAARRADLAEGLQELTEAVANALRIPSDDTSHPTSDTDAPTKLTAPSVERWREPEAGGIAPRPWS